MLQLSIQDYEGKSTVIPLADGELSIGRDDSNSICLTERNVSRRHAVIMATPSGVYLENVAATFGTRLNNRLVRERAQIKTGDVVQIGDYTLQVLGAGDIQPDTALVDEAAQQASLPPKPVENATAIVNLADIQLGMAETSGGGEGAAIPAAQQPRLVVESDNLRGWEGRLARSPTVIGRVADSADLVIDHRSISKEHARLTRKPDGSWEVLDLGSANGIQVNGEPYSKCAIQSGDTLVLGHVTLRFLGAGERAPAAGATSSGGAGGGKGLIIAAVALLVLLAGAGLAFFVLGGESDDSAGGAAVNKAAGDSPEKSATAEGSADQEGSEGATGGDEPTGGDSAGKGAAAPKPGAKSAAVAETVRKVTKLEKAGMLSEGLAFASDALKKHPGSAELDLLVKRLQAETKTAARIAAAKKRLKKDPKGVLDAMTDLEADAKGVPSLAKDVAVLKAQASMMVVNGLVSEAKKLLSRGRYSRATEKAEMCQALAPDNQACTDLIAAAKAKTAERNARGSRRAKPASKAAPTPRPTPRPTKRVVVKKEPTPPPTAAPAAMSAKDYYKAGRKAASSGDNRKAVGLFEKAVSAGYKRAHGKLARLYFQLGNKSKCALHGKRYINRYPDAGDAPQIEGLVEKCK